MTGNAINQRRQVTDLYSAITGNPGVPTAAELARSDAGPMVLQAEPIYWSPAIMLSNRTRVVTSATAAATTVGTTSYTGFGPAGAAAVNWPFAGLPSAMPTVPAGGPTINTLSGGYDGDPITVDPTVTGPVAINGGTNFVRLSGGAGDDYLISSAANASLLAASGNDVLYATGSQSALVGGSGHDISTSGVRLMSEPIVFSSVPEI